ncbi:MAG TPA: ANTAR domain-containing protein [Streptosporangiaceae bacterium]
MLDRNAAQQLATEAAELLNVAAVSDTRSLHQLADLAARQVPACSGATAALWRDGEPVAMTATHPDLSELFELSRETCTSPWQAALASGEMISCPDTLTEKRWPEFASAALFRGVRCTLTMVATAPPAAITLTLFAARPGVLDAGQVALAQLLVAFGGTMMGNASSYGDSQRAAQQLRDAAASRAVVDQAKGILMHALGCTAQEAFEKMRVLSQRRHVKVTEVARTIIESHPRGPS